MNTKRTGVLRTAAAALLAVAIPKICFLAHSNRSTAAMLTLLAMLAVATLGDWVLALVTSASGILAFAWYFLDVPGQNSAADGFITFATMTLTALTGTFLALRAQQRTEEAELRRGQLERMTQMGQQMAASQTFSEVAQAGVRAMTELFGVSGARLRLGEEWGSFESGRVEGEARLVPLRMPPGAVLELFGAVPIAEEVRTALGGMISVHLERSLALEARARTEAEKRSESLRSTVLNALAHDFRTPLTSIKVAASMLRAGGEVPAESERELIEVIDEEADRLDRLLRESLALARIDGKRRNPGEEECEIPDIVERVREKMARYLGRREFVVELPAELPRVKGDAFLFEQMLTQVTDNAWKYSEPGSRIGITAADNGSDTLTLTVRNEGSRIPESERELIFEKFYRGSNQRSKSQGTGLGLAIARTIVETYGGRIRLEAEPLGPAFHFDLRRAGTAAGKPKVLAGQAAD
jgi:two-component system sensor histidine kinase KdpD